MPEVWNGRASRDDARRWKVLGPRLLPHGIWLAGLLVILYSGYFGALIPAQDPPPEIQALRAAELRSSERWIVMGFVLVALGIVSVVARAISRRTASRR